MKKFLSVSSLILAATISSTSVCAAQNNNQQTMQPTAKPAFSTMQVEQIEQIIHNYLVNKNPQIMVEVAQKLQQKALITEKERVKTSVAKYSKDVFNSNLGGRISIGNSKGNVILAEFLSYECGHCRVTNKLIHDLVKANPDLQVIYIYWPFQGNDAVYAVKAVIAADQQGKFEELHNALMDAKDYLTRENIDKIAKAIPGLDFDKLQKDVSQQENAIDEGLKINFKLAENMKLIGTPTFVTASRTLNKFSVVPGEANEVELKKALDEVR